MAILADKFFESYDMLPQSYKELIYASATCPTMQDLETVWKLVQEERSFADLFREYARKYNPEEYREIKAREKAEYDAKNQRDKHRAWEAKQQAWLARNGIGGRYMNVTVRNPNYIDPNDKHSRLVARVAEDRALDLITKKKAKLVNTTSKTITYEAWVPYKSASQRQAEERARDMKKWGIDLFAPPNKNPAGTNKRLGNAY